jgi:hypothetical protein
MIYLVQQGRPSELSIFVSIFHLFIAFEMLLIYTSNAIRN